MATTLKKIRADLDKAHPEIAISRDGVVGVMTEAEREAWLDEQAEIAFADEAGWRNLRVQRDALLRDSDWTQIADAPVDAKAWAAYRKALRDLPKTTAHPSEVVWPTPPGAAE